MNKSTIFGILLALAGTFVSAANEAEVFEDVTPAKAYKPVTDHNPLNVIKFSADPGVMVYDDTVYVYGTNDGILELMDNPPKENDYDKIHTLNVMSSKDLVNWVDHGTIPSAEKEGAAKWAHNSWAPAATHKKINGKDKFFLYFANSGNGIGVLTSDSPTGPFVDPIGDFLISKESPNCADVTWLFDPAVFVDDDGTGYIYFGGGIPGEYDDHPLYKDAPLFERPRTLRVAKLADDMISLASEPVVLDAPWPYEDSGIHKVDDTYYYTYCTNWNEKSPFGQARIGMMASKDPMGPFEFVDTIFNNPGDFFEFYGNNHHTVIQFHDKWYIFYHAEWLNTRVFGEKLGYRTTHVNELPYVDGKFLNATGTLEGVPQLFNVDAYQTQLASLMAWEAGVSTNGLGHTTVTYQKGEWTGVSQVDFADGAEAIKVNASSKNGAVIRITVDDVDGDVIGYVTIPAGEDFEEVTAEITKVEGVKNVFFLASDEVVVDTWEFVKAEDAAENSNDEPTEELDDVEDSGEDDADAVETDNTELDDVEDSGVEEEEKESEKPEDEKAEDEKPEDEKAEDEKPEDEKAEDEKPEDEKAEDEQPEDEKAEDEQPEDEKAEDENPEDADAVETDNSELNEVEDSNADEDDNDEASENAEESEKDDEPKDEDAKEENEAPTEEAPEDEEPTEEPTDDNEESANEENLAPAEESAKEEDVAPAAEVKKPRKCVVKKKN